MFSWELKRSKKRWFRANTRPKKSRVRAVMVGLGKCGRVGNGSGRERESRVYLVPDRDFPTPSRPRSLFPPSTVPIYGILFPSRLFPVPPQGVFPTFSVPPSAQLFPSHPDLRTQILPSRNSLKWQMFPSHLPCVYFLHHTTMDTTGLFLFGLFNFGCDSCSSSLI